MLKDIQNSIKAKLYDFTYSPFMSSMIISWIIINHKYILIYMANYDLDKKLALLKQYDFTWHTTWFHVPWVFNIWIPILFGLFYTFIYPMASKKFYEYTLEKNKELKEIKQDIEDITPITQEEARTLRESITQLTENKYELEKKLIEIEDRYKKKIQEKKEKLTNYIGPPIIDVDKDIKNLPKIIKNKEDDKIKFLRYLYESNYKEKSTSSLLDGVVVKTKMARPKAKKLFDSFIKDNILHKNSYSNIEISDKGNAQLLEIFDKEK